MSAAQTVTVPNVESEIARDLGKRALLVLPAFALFGAIGWGWAGVASVAVAVAIIALNFLIAAAIVGACAKISPGAFMGGVLFGILFRMGLIVLALIALRNVSWVAKTPLGISLIVLQLGLLTWETRYVSASLAFPGLAPKKVLKVKE